MGCNSKGPLGLDLSLGGKSPDETVVLLRKEEDPFAPGKGKTTSVFLEVQSISSAKKKVMFGSKKLWFTLFSPRSESQ